MFLGRLSNFRMLKNSVLYFVLMIIAGILNTIQTVKYKKFPHAEQAILTQAVIKIKALRLTTHNFIHDHRD
jgi:hypothetical protein